MQKLNTLAFGWAIAIVEALAVLFGWLLAAFGDANEFLDLMAMVYIGLDASFVGLLIGLVEAVAVGFAFGYIMAWVYNHKASKMAGGADGEVHHYTCSECGKKFQTEVLLGDEENAVCTVCANK
jgi:hypothetical protein